MKLRFTVQGKLLISHFLAVLLVSGSVGSFFFAQAKRNLLENVRVRLQNSAALIAECIDARELHAIRTADDVVRPEYERNLSLIRMLRLTNADISFIYVMRRAGGRVEFVIDSDDTADQALPGREYTETVPALLTGFARASVDEGVTEDEWGAFLSGYAPLRNGRGEYLVGMDMRVDHLEEKFQALRTAGWISLGGAILLAFFFSRLLAIGFTVPVRLLIARCASLARGFSPEPIEYRANDEFDTLIGSFNDMSEHLAEADRQRAAALDEMRRARDELETRVVQRTQDLELLNRQLIVEIVERKKAEEALQHAALTDALTEIPNRRAMTEDLRRHAARSARSGASFAMVLVDVDHFKSVNDNYGHEVGDTVLRDTAAAIRRGIREQDVVARWGGEEFLVILPDTKLADAVLVAEKIRARVAGQVFEAAGRDLRTTVSAGVAVFDGSAPLERVLRDADDALYRAKSGGRNAVAAADCA